MHPRDWAHPGRIKVELYNEVGIPKNPNIKDSIIHYSLTSIREGIV